MSVGTVSHIVVHTLFEQRHAKIAFGTHPDSEGPDPLTESLDIVLRARRNEKEMKVKPATSFKLLTIFIHKKIR